MGKERQEPQITTAADARLIQWSTTTVTTTHTVVSEHTVFVQSHSVPSPASTPISSRDRLQADCSSFGVGDIFAVVLGVLLLVQLIACTVAWVVCAKRKCGRMDREGIGMLCLSDRNSGYNGPLLWHIPNISCRTM